MQARVLAVVRGVMSVVVITPIALCTQAESSSQDATYHHVSALQDLAFTTPPLTEVTVASVVMCGGQCLASDQCIVFTLLPTTGHAQQFHCRLYGNIPLTTEQSTGARSYEARPDYSLICGHYVKFVSTRLTVTAARQHCWQLHFGGLLVISSLSEVVCFADMVDSYGFANTLLWLGGERVIGTDNFLWDDGQLLPADSPLWGPLQPEDDDCLVIQPYTDMVHDTACDNPDVRVFCERSP